MAGKKLTARDIAEVLGRIDFVARKVHGSVYKDAFLDAAEVIRVLAARRLPTDVEADKFTIDTATETKQLRIECVKDGRVLSRLTLDSPEEIYQLSEQLLSHYDKFEGLKDEVSPGS